MAKPTTKRTISTAESAPMQVFGRATLSDICDDLVFYRSLEPLDKRLPKLKSALRKLDLSGIHTPRKTEREYAQIALWYAVRAQELRGQSSQLAEILFLGDTLYGDGQAYEYMRQVSGWRSSCFVGADRFEQAPESIADEITGLYQANRWSALGDWLVWAKQTFDLQLDQQTLLVVDIDKTALGAKGRNDHVIDQARLEGAYNTMSSLLSSEIDGGQFERYYSELNRGRYHALTADNQDYLAYICLVLSTGLIAFDEVVDSVEDGSLDSFTQFLRLVETRMMINTVSGEAFRQAHDAVVTSVRAGDPTPFKRFRRQEFISTVKRMGTSSDDTPVEDMLAQEIALTNEVFELAAWLRDRGSLVLCLSDKPEEASCPHRHVSPDLPPVHRVESHLIGTSNKSLLDSAE